MIAAAKIIGFIISSMPTILKIVEFIKMAATAMEGKTGPEKREWVMAKIKEVLPQLTSDEAYNWVNGLVALLRNMGLKI